MSLAGVRSNRGDNYQTLVAFEWALSILVDDKYQWLEVDSTSLDENGAIIPVDDVVIGCSDGNMICCQCKKNQIDSKPWSIADLGEELSKAARFLASNPKSQVKFYSHNNFGALAKLREHSRTQPNFQAFLQSLTQKHKTTNAELENFIPKTCQLTTFEWLQRTTFEVSPGFERAKELLKERLSYQASNAENAFNAIWTQLDNLGARTNSDYTSGLPNHRLYKADILRILEKSGATLVRPKSQQEIIQLFASASAVGRQWRRDIAGKRIHVDTVATLLGAIESQNKSILLSGVPGSGKTCVLLELYEQLEIRNELATLFIQSREYANYTTPEARAAHGLPEDLVGLVGRMSDIKRTVVIIDSLDVLSLSREHSVLSFFLAQIDRLLLIPNVNVIAACREFDRKYDRNLSIRDWDCIVNNQPLDWQTVVSPLTQEYDINPDSLDATTRSLLQNPRELAMFTEIAQRTGGFNVTTSQALSRKYLDEIVRNDPMLGDTAISTLEKIAVKMLKARKLDISRLQTEISDDILKRLLSANVLHLNQSDNIEFGHQTLLDVLVVSDAQRNSLKLKDFIAQLPAVPFVRPTIRAYAAYLAAGDRLSFRKQLRALFDSEAAFHIRRLVVETLAEQIPQDDDWSLIKHLHGKHRGLFNSLYIQASSLDWHSFWLKHLVPFILQERDAQSLTAHVQRISLWKQTDPSGVVDFWSLALKQTWADVNLIARNIVLDFHSFDYKAVTNILPLIETLLNLPRREHDQFGNVIARCIKAGIVGDDVLWCYIAGEINGADLLGYKLGDKLRCNPSEFKDNNFLQQRMVASEQLLKLAIDTVEAWSTIKSNHSLIGGSWSNHFLDSTSYEKNHSQRDISHVSAETILFMSLEKAILHHAKAHTNWWITHKQRLCSSCEGAFCYIAILALTEEPEQNLFEVARMIANKDLLASSLHFELGNLIHKAFVYLDSAIQDEIQTSILALSDDKKIDETPWILKRRAEFLVTIPIHLRSPDAQSALLDWEKSFGTCIRQPNIGRRGGFVSAPFSYERFLEFTDTTVLKILEHYSKDQDRNWDDFLVGGSDEVEWQLREAASRSPLRFIQFLKAYWINIPERFTDDILEGAATYLEYRYGNLQFDANEWQAIEEPEPQLLASLMLDEIDRHPGRWHHCRAAAKALEACANVIDLEKEAARLLFNAIGFINLYEKDYGKDSKDLIGIGLNMTRGDVAEAVMITTTRLAEDKQPFPDLLIPTLSRFASDSHPAIRALILRRLPYLQRFLPELGWKIFHLATKGGEERLWVVAEPCLYYSYRKDFDTVSAILERLISTSAGKALETWGRIAALAVFPGHVSLPDFIAKLRVLGSVDAWKGAAMVWTNKGNFAQQREQCLEGIQAGLADTGDIAYCVANQMSSLFRKDEPISYIPFAIVDQYFSAIEQDQNNDHHGFYGFDEWLNAISLSRPNEALLALERFIVFIERTKHRVYDFGKYSQLLDLFWRKQLNY